MNTPFNVYFFTKDDPQTFLYIGKSGGFDENVRERRVNDRVSFDGKTLSVDELAPVKRLIKIDDKWMPNNNPPPEESDILENLPQFSEFIKSNGYKLEGEALELNSRLKELQSEENLESEKFSY